MLNIFTGDAFSVVRMTQAINDLKYVPGRLAELGLFEVDRVDTTIISVEKKGEILVIVPPTPRGSPGNTIDREQRDLRALIVPHFEVNDSVMADSIQNVRAFGSDSTLETIVGKVAMRQQVHANSFSATEEHSRMGAVKGIVSYADGTSLNLFSEFGVTVPAVADFDLDNAAPDEGALRKLCAGITRRVMDALGGIPFTGIHVLCGDNFFDQLLSHPEVRETYIGWNAAQILRESYIGPNRKSYGIFEFGGLVFENYRGASIPSAAKGAAVQTFIGTDDCYAFPLGVPGLFKTVYAPADMNETVNTLGERLYTHQYPMPNGKGIHLDSQMNALQYCSRPQVLVHGTRT